MTEETTGMIGAAALARMPCGSVLVHCARGALLGYDALCDALDSGHPGGRRARPLPPGAKPRASSGRTSAATCAAHHRPTAPTRR
ncbi:NAD(P)-dependent oxidoreductase [Streptomyces longispororuber]|uniref:NAD(P)-dependent oxidoreductase n=1 Tax=Streptomyces longispororuber TaxID=68230 RepID=UPI001E4EEC88|nr:NAD(P)-dependent oxidoreductase [Streptomyces longispororuber]